MPTVDSVSSSGFSSALSGAAGDRNSMGQEAFLNLLVAQLQNQDPLNPQDNSEFVAQLAQYSSLEQQINTNDHLEAIASSYTDMERASATGYIGKMISGQSDSFSLAPSAQFGNEVGELNGELGYVLEADAQEVTVNILNSRGVVVATMDNPPRGAGEHRFTWDGKDHDGSALPPGNYKMEVKAKNYSEDQEAEVPANPIVLSRVTGVEFDANQTLLVTGIGRVPMSDITNLTEAPQ